MSDSLTANVGLTKPGIGASEQTWGNKLNADLDLIDLLLFYAIPIGVVMDFGGATLPAGWLLCDGSAISRTTYSNLFAVIGTTFGIGDGGTTFNLPNLSGRMTLGSGTLTDGNGETMVCTLGQTYGTYQASITQSVLPNYPLAMSGTDGTHSHSYSTLAPVNPAPEPGGGSIGYNAIDPANVVAMQTVSDNFSAHSHTIHLGGGRTQIDITKPVLALNRMIYAGAQAA